jgi:hypothetical protein
LHCLSLIEQGLGLCRASGLVQCIGVVSSLTHFLERIIATVGEIDALLRVSQGLRQVADG